MVQSHLWNLKKSIGKLNEIRVVVAMDAVTDLFLECLSTMSSGTLTIEQIF